MTLLEKSSHVALLVVCAVSLFAIGDRYFRTAGPHTVPSESQLKGRKISVPGTPDFRGTTTILVAVGSQCRYCRQSLPFYSRLQSECSKGDKSARLVFTSSEDEDVIQSFLASGGLKKVEFFKTSQLNVGIEATPTLLILGRDGVVLQPYIGKQSPGGEARILAAIVGQ